MILSEKTLPITELGQEAQALRGFNVIATANDRDKGSTSCPRRFVDASTPSSCRYLIARKMK